MYMNGNVDRYELVKCVEEIIGADNLISDPEITNRNILVKVKKSSNLDIPKHDKKIADHISNFIEKPFGITIIAI